VRLFVDRAQAVKPDFRLTVQNAAAVAAICHRLDGLPLAIELAAARIRLLAPDQMLARLHHRLPLLTGGAQTLPVRQQTLRNAVAWSYDLLVPREQVLLQRLAVFAGGCTLDAAEAIAGVSADAADAAPIDVLDGLESLAAKSLLRRVEPEGGEPRFVMLEVIREFALERLAASGGQTAARQAHGHYFAALAERAEPELIGPQQATWLERLEREHHNLVATLAWSSADGDTSTGLRLATAAWLYWQVRAHVPEAMRWIAQLLDRAAGDPAVSDATRARALHAAGGFAWVSEDQVTAERLLGEAAALHEALGDERGAAVAWSILGRVALRQGHDAAAEGYFTRALTLCASTGDQWLHAQTLEGMSLVAQRRGDLGAAYRLEERYLAIMEQVGDVRAVASGHALTGRLEYQQGNLDEAAAYWRRARGARTSHLTSGFRGRGVWHRPGSAGGSGAVGQGGPGAPVALAAGGAAVIGGADVGGALEAGLAAVALAGEAHEGLPAHGTHLVDQALAALDGGDAHPFFGHSTPHGDCAGSVPPCAAIVPQYIILGNTRYRVVV
jgi:tetratricopeptide (TPR) repeat protein